MKRERGNYAIAVQANEFNHEKAVDFKLSLWIILPVRLNLTILSRDTLALHVK